MSYEDDFTNDTGWSAVDTNIRLDTEQGRLFIDELKKRGVSTIVRYYASSRRPKTLSRKEAIFLSSEGFSLLPVFQDRNRRPEDFGAAKGRSNARSALDFADYIGQPKGSCILFAADADFGPDEVTEHIIPYFEAARETIGSAYRIGAYGSGLVLKTLLREDLIEVPWISMSRLFRGTEEFFYSTSWAMRQVPPAKVHRPSGVNYDRNVARWTEAELGTFQIAKDGSALLAAGRIEDATLGEETEEPVAALAGDAPPNAYVSTEGLNLRDGPDGTILKELTIGQPVIDLGPAGGAGWRHVTVEGTRGVVFGKYLRSPSTPEIEALLANAVAEWVRFDKGRANERSDPYYRYVGEMWASIGESYDGRSLYPNGEEVPWSAAFISFVVRESGAAYRNFKFASSHSVFSHDAIQARILNRVGKPFWGFRRSEQRPEIGDIIHRNRGGGSFTFDYAENHSEFKSHSDIVVEVTPRVARVLGGNVGDTVSMRDVGKGGDDIQEYLLDENGFLASGQGVIAVLKNRASDVGS